jgi:hypothetical protein
MRFALESRGIGEGGQVLADDFRVLVVLLELDPFRLLGKGSELTDVGQ